MVAEWPETQFGELLTEPVRNGIYKEKAFHGRGAKIVNMGELFACPRLRAVQMKRVALSQSEADRFLLAPGDLLFARRSLVAEGAGKCSIVLEVDEATTFESSIIRARPDRAKADPLYLYYFFNSPLGLYHLDTIRRQVAVAGITGADLVKLAFAIPPAPEQRAIAHILGTLDDKIELNRRMNETLEAMARAIFQSWFVDFDPVRAKAEGRETGLPKHLADLFPDSFVELELGMIPEGWRVCSILDLAGNIQYGFTQRASPNRVGPYFLRITDIQGGKVDWEAVPFCEVTPKEHERYCLKPGDVLVARTGASTGENIYLSQTPDAVFASYLVRFQFPDLAIARLVGAFMRTHAYFEYVASGVGGSAQPNANAQVLAGAKLVVPTPSIARTFADLVMPLDVRIGANAHESRTLAVLRDTLLPKLISGELRIKDAERFIQRAAT